MANIQQKKQEEHKNPISLLAAGAAIGVGVAVATILTLNNKDSQKKVKKVLTKVKEYAKESIDKLKKNSNLASGTKKIKAVVGEVKKD